MSARRFLHPAIEHLKTPDPQLRDCDPGQGIAQVFAQELIRLHHQGSDVRIAPRVEQHDHEHEGHRGRLGNRNDEHDELATGLARSQEIDAARGRHAKQRQQRDHADPFCPAGQIDQQPRIGHLEVSVLTFRHINL